MIAPAARTLSVALAALIVAAAAPTPASPWFGKWKLSAKDAGDKPETLIYSDAGRGAMRMVSVEEDTRLTTRFDGKPAEISAKAGPKRTLAIKALSANSYRWIFSSAGTPLVEGVNTISPDGRSFQEVSWLIAKPEKRVTLTYERQ